MAYENWCTKIAKVSGPNRKRIDILGIALAGGSNIIGNVIGGSTLGLAWGNMCAHDTWVLNT